MNYTRIAILAACTAVAGVVVAAPAQADPQTDAFLDAINDSGITGLDPATAVSVGRDVCPMLAEPGQQVADVAANVSEAIGRPLGPATAFTGLAITLFCPGAVAAVANGQSPFPMGIPGF